MFEHRMIKLHEVPFLPYYYVETLRMNIQMQLWYKFLDAALVHNSMHENDIRA